MTNTTKEDLQNLMVQVVKGSKFFGLQRAKTGKYNSTTGKVEPALTELPFPNMVWVRFAPRDEPLAVYNIGKVSRQQVDITVWVGEDENGDMTIMSVDNAETVQSFGVSATDIVQPEVVVSKQSIITNRSMSMLRPSKLSDTNFTVFVSAYDDSTITWDGGTQDHVDDVPTTANKSKWIVGVLDTSGNPVLATRSGSEVNYVASLPKGWQSVTVNSTDIPLYAINLVAGESSFNENDIIDIREFINKPSSSSGGGITTVQSEGVDVSTTRAKINIINSINIDASVADNSGDNRTDLTLSTTDLVMQKDTIDSTTDIPTGYTVVHSAINVTGDLDVSGKLITV